MPYNPPTQTNPPFTNPVIWPFPTSAEDWETNYRLRLLEAAMLYMWTAGGGASQGCVPVSNGVPPPTDGSTIAPPEGYLWVDTSINPVMGINYVLLTSSGTWAIPAGVTKLRIRAQGGGGGGGGGGSSQVTTPVAQAGGAGGAAGSLTDLIVSLNPTDTTLTITIGAGGTAGSGGAAGSGATGNPGTNGGNGGFTRVAGTQTSTNYAQSGRLGGGLGRGGAASSATAQGAGQSNSAANGNTQTPGMGDAGWSTFTTGTPFPNGACGGTTGSAASATTPFNGGTGGLAINPSNPIGSLNPNPAGTMSSPQGGNAITPTVLGCGGGGGGGGGAGGAGGNGSPGMPGSVEIWW